MLCPSCGNELTPEEISGLQVDVCKKCSGVWFDQGELGRLLHTDPALQTQFNEELKGEPQNVGHLKRVCPKCQQALESYKYAYASPIVLDYCPSCDGIFVDQGELPQIEQYLSHSSQSDAAAKMALATSELDADIDQSRQRALSIARSVWTRRMCGSWSWWQLGLEQPPPK